MAVIRGFALWLVPLFLMIVADHGGSAFGQDAGQTKEKPLYQHGPDSQEQQDVPRGREVAMGVWKSNIFAGSERHWWLYVPAQYDDAMPACVMVFLDGLFYFDRKGDFRAPVVFDNLIHQRKMPVTIGVFLQPGVVPSETTGGKDRDNCSSEYDTLSDQYARFLENEILPEVGKTYRLRKDAAGRAIGGMSSGALARSPLRGNGRTCSAKC